MAYIRHIQTRNVAEFIFYGLQALQHRGQESAGIAVSDGEDLLVFKDLGLVSPGLFRTKPCTAPG